MIKGRFNGFLPSLIWTIVIVILSVLPGETVRSTSFLELWNVDKVGHLIVYMIHSYLLLYGFSKRNDRKMETEQVMIVILLSVGLGVLLEVIQHFWTHDRQFDLLDMFANVLGTTIGVVLFKLLHK